MTPKANGEHHTPFESLEYRERESWRKKVTDKDLSVIPCVSAWSDICGYGKLLEECRWDLQTVRDKGFFEALSLAYECLGRPLIVGAPPSPTERVLLINDGVARTTDLTGPDHVNSVNLLFYVRDLLIAHFLLMGRLSSLNLGLRTVLSGGERCQYSPQRISGESILYHSGNPSEYGRALLAQQFVYYPPPEFQLNTAFSSAYTIDALGSAEGIKPNRLYITRTWVDTISGAFPGPITVTDSAIIIPHRGGPGLSIYFDQRLQVNAKGLRTEVFKIEKLVVHANFEVEETVFPMNEYDSW